jgi:hypothetical protein
MPQVQEASSNQSFIVFISSFISRLIIVDPCNDGPMRRAKKRIDLQKLNKQLETGEAEDDNYKNAYR